MVPPPPGSWNRDMASNPSSTWRAAGDNTSGSPLRTDSDPAARAQYRLYHEILKFRDDNPRITNRAVAERFGVKSRTVENIQTRRSYYEKPPLPDSTVPPSHTAEPRATSDTGQASLQSQHAPPNLPSPTDGKLKLPIRVSPAPPRTLELPSYARGRARPRSSSEAQTAPPTSSLETQPAVVQTPVRPFSPAGKANQKARYELGKWPAQPVPGPQPSAQLPLPPQTPQIPQKNSLASSHYSPRRLGDEVLEYLHKKGYSKTEAMLRRESTYQDPEGRPIFHSLTDQGGSKYFRSYDLIKEWILTDNLEVYKTELKRLLWPLFVYCFLELVGEFYPRDSEQFFAKYRGMFEREHPDDLRALSSISLPEHAQSNEVAKLYRGSKYRLSISLMAFSTMLEFLETHREDGGTVILNVIQNRINLFTMDRNKSSEYSLSAIMAKGTTDLEMPGEDEGIPGHYPGSANTSVNAPEVLTRLALGPAHREQELMEDVRAELLEEDAKNPPLPGRNTLVEEMSKTIKQEPDEDTPNRDAVPLPPSTARDVAMEVQKIKENRDRFPIPLRSGGVGPGVSVVMYTFHNTHGNINCVEFSGDLNLVAAGTAESYIRIQTLDGSPLPSQTDKQSTSTRRLIGHSAPVYGLSFSPAATPPQNSPAHYPPNATNARVLLSASSDKTIRLWSLDTYTCLVNYKGHDKAVWDISWGPFGHYFVSASSDKSARLWSSDHIAPLRIFAGHDNDVVCLTWHPNGAYVFTGSDDRTVRMWDVARGTAVRLFTGHTEHITAISAAPNGKLVASADTAGSIIIWDITTGRRKKRMRGHGKGGIWSLDWSVESSVIVSGGADDTVRVWDVPLQTPDSMSSQPGAGAAGGKTNADVQGAQKVGGESSAAAAAAAAAAGQQQAKTGAKKGKDVFVTPDQISCFPTKKSTVYKTAFTRQNLVLAASAFMP
ncbi:MAG: Transcription initiation factor TFIID subunit 5 [Bogoriella megaspora]|nr:MAG: Transcription initiation factor TFIID subunit 5 [Bogoriella megaspora]